MKTQTHESEKNKKKEKIFFRFKTKFSEIDTEDKNIVKKLKNVVV